MLYKVTDKKSRFGNGVLYNGPCHLVLVLPYFLE